MKRETKDQLKAMLMATGIILGIWLCCGGCATALDDRLSGRYPYDGPLMIGTNQAPVPTW